MAGETWVHQVPKIAAAVERRIKSWNGGVEFNGGAYDPVTNTFFVPSSNQCAKWSATEQAEFIPGQFYLGGSEPKLTGPNSGWFNAINVSHGSPCFPAPGRTALVHRAVRTRS